MIKQHIYRYSDKMSDLICCNYSLLQVLSRFGIPMGFGNKKVKDVCNKQQIDPKTFLCVVNFIASDEPTKMEHPEIKLNDLLLYLQQAHIYFIDFNLPTIRKKLVDALELSPDRTITTSILKFFDDYAAEVRRHMEYENKNIFQYIGELIQGNVQENYSIIEFEKMHKAIDDKHVEAKLSDLKNIIIKYYPSQQVNYLLNSVLADIFSSERELALHCYIEDYILVPAVLDLEKKLKKS